MSLKSYFREAILAEMGVALKEDGGTIGVFSPKKVGYSGIIIWMLFTKYSIISIVHVCFDQSHIDFHKMSIQT